VKWGVIDANAFHEVDKTGYVPPARERCPTHDEYAAVYSIATDRMRIAMDLALLVGMRKGGVLRLGDLLEDGLRSQQPGKKTKPLLFEWTPELRSVAALAQSLEPRARRALLCTQEGTAYTEAGFQANWWRLMDTALERGLIDEPFHFNDIRVDLAPADADAPAS
jgi:hypothetical protein